MSNCVSKKMFLIKAMVFSSTKNFFHTHRQQSYSETALQRISNGIVNRSVFLKDQLQFSVKSLDGHRLNGRKYKKHSFLLSPLPYIVLTCLLQYLIFHLMEEILPEYFHKIGGKMNVTNGGIREVNPMTCGYGSII